MRTMLFRINHPNPELSAWIVNQLPEELFRSSMSTFLDPSMGGGNLLAAIRDRLQQFGHSEDNILSRLYGFETNEIYIRYAESRNALRGANLSIMKYNDFLKWEENMKFDCVVMNPPFNDNQEEKKRSGDLVGKRRSTPKLLHVDFIKKSLQIATHVAVICPVAKWFGPQSTYKFYKTLADCGLYFIDWESEKVFERKIRGGLGIFIFNKNNKNTTIEVCYQRKHLKTQNADELLSFDTDKLEHFRLFMASRDNLGNYYNQKTSVLNRTQLAELVTDIPDNEHCFDCFETINVKKFATQETQQTDATRGNIRVAFNHNGTHNHISAIVVDRSAMLSYSVDCLIVEDENQAREWVDYLHSERIQKLLPIIKTSNTNAKKYFALMPLPSDQEGIKTVDQLINEQ